MRNALLIASSVFLLAACKEKGFDVTPAVEGGDTTYMAAPELAQARTVVLEEFTGVTCPNCPAGHKKVAAMKTRFPGRFIAVSYYANGPGQAEPVEGKTKEDFRTVDATDIASSIFGGISGLPTAGIDRVKTGGELLAFQNAWENAVNNRMGVSSPANVTMTSEWNAADRTAIIRVRVAYTSDVSKKQALTLMLTENDLVDAQETTDSTSSSPLVLSEYTFKHVLRDIITPVTGEAVLNEMAVKERGRVYERTFVYKIPDDKSHWKAENCTLIAIVHNAEGDDKEMVQAAEVDLLE